MLLQRCATAVKTVADIRPLGKQTEAVDESGLQPEVDPATGDTVYPDSQAYGEYLDEETWLDWQTRYQHGPGTQLMPLKETDLPLRIREYRRQKRGELQREARSPSRESEMGEDRKMMKERLLVADVEAEFEPSPSRRKEFEWIVQPEEVKEARRRTSSESESQPQKTVGVRTEEGNWAFDLADVKRLDAISLPACACTSNINSDNTQYNSLKQTHKFTALVQDFDPFVKFSRKRPCLAARAELQSTASVDFNDFDQTVSDNYIFYHQRAPSICVTCSGANEDDNDSEASVNSCSEATAESHDRLQVPSRQVIENLGCIFSRPRRRMGSVENLNFLWASARPSLGDEQDKTIRFSPVIESQWPDGIESQCHGDVTESPGLRRTRRTSSKLSRLRYLRCLSSFSLPADDHITYSDPLECLFHDGVSGLDEPNWDQLMNTLDPFIKIVRALLRGMIMGALLGILTNALWPLVSALLFQVDNTPASIQHDVHLPYTLPQLHSNAYPDLPERFPYPRCRYDDDLVDPTNISMYSTV